MEMRVVGEQPRRNVVALIAFQRCAERLASYPSSEYSIIAGIELLIDLTTDSSKPLPSSMSGSVLLRMWQLQSIIAHRSNGLMIAHDERKHKV